MPLTKITSKQATYLPAGAGAVATDVQTKLRESVSVFDFMTSAQVAQILSGSLSGQNGNDIADAIQRAADEHLSVYLPAGNYLLGHKILMTRAGQRIHGEGIDATNLWVDAATFPSETVGGSTGKSVIWFQAPGAWDGGAWINEGGISDLTIWGNGFAGECIRVNRVVGGVYENLRLAYANMGFYGTHSGWSSSFINVHCTEHVISGISLAYAWNGCSFVGCNLFGQGLSTQVLLNIRYASYGNSWVGGAIEGGTVGVRLTSSQLAISGVDFEIITEAFIQARGEFSIPPIGGTLNFAGPVSTVTGCSFFGVPSDGGIVADGASVQMMGNFANTLGASVGSSYFLKGNSGGDPITGFAGQCISDIDTHYRGWGANTATGIVSSRIKKVATQSVTFPTAAVLSADVNTLDEYTEGTFTPVQNGAGWGSGMTLSGKYTKIGNLVNFVVTIAGATNSTTTASYMEGFPHAFASSSVASTADSYNYGYANSVINAPGLVYMPTIASTPANIIVRGSYFTA